MSKGESRVFSSSAVMTRLLAAGVVDVDPCLREAASMIDRAVADSNFLKESYDSRFMNR